MYTEQTFLIAGAILLVRVPATIITSDCLGLARNTTPNLSMSYLGAAKCIISTAQQARPNVIGHMDPCKQEFYQSLDSRKPVFGVSDQLRHKPACEVITRFITPSIGRQSLHEGVITYLSKTASRS